MTDAEQILLNRVKLVGDGEWTLIGTPQELIDEINRLIVEARVEELKLLLHPEECLRDDCRVNHIRHSRRIIEARIKELNREVES